MRNFLSIFILVLVAITIRPSRGGYSILGMNLKMANAAIDAAIEETKKLGTKPMNIAVVDVGANLVSFARMDGAWLGSVDIAIKKAKTATFFDMASGKIGNLSQPGGSLYNIEHSNGGLISFPGGLPIYGDHNGTLIGGIGVSGDSVENDKAVAMAGKRKYENLT